MHPLGGGNGPRYLLPLFRFEIRIHAPKTGRTAREHAEELFAVADVVEEAEVVDYASFIFLSGMLMRTVVPLSGRPLILTFPLHG